MKITRFEDVESWKEAKVLVKTIYQMTKHADFSKDYRLAGQIQAAAVSCMSNIAEGFDRRSNRDFLRFLDISYSSATEVQSELYVAIDQMYISDAEFSMAYEQAAKIKRLIAGFARYLRTSLKK